MDNHPSDHKIRQHFEQRHIQPSSEAWDKLNAGLSATGKSDRMSLTSYAIAAACVTMLFMAGYFLLDYDAFWTETSQQDVIVQDKTDNRDLIYPFDKMGTTKSDNTEKTNVPLTNNVLTVSEVKNNTIYSPLITKRKTNSVPLMNDNKSFHNNTVTYDLDAPDLKKEEEATESNLNTGNTKNIKVKKPYIKPKHLLVAVESEIVSIKKAELKKEIRSKYGLDPKSLLKEAEEREAQTFMAKVWKSVQETSGPIITAVTERNQVK
ncbi:MAG: hypothetical protein H7X99_09200 [Saprospiraceae bacterium]|nr:hypothetical protein [Saprospiraceae bacterium]